MRHYESTIEHKGGLNNNEVEKAPGYQRLEGSEHLLADKGPFVKRFQDKLKAYEIALSHLDGMDFSDNEEQIINAMETAAKALNQSPESREKAEWLTKDIEAIRSSDKPLEYARHSVRNHFLSLDGAMGELMDNVGVMVEGNVTFST